MVASLSNAAARSLATLAVIAAMASQSATALPVSARQALLGDVDAGAAQIAPSLLIDMAGPREGDASPSLIESTIIMPVPLPAVLGQAYDPLSAVPEPSATGFDNLMGINNNFAGPSQEEIAKSIVEQTSNLAMAVAEAIITESPMSLIQFAGGILTLITGFGLEGGPTPLEEFMQQMDNKLNQISANLEQMSASIEKTLQVSNEIKMDLHDSQLQNVLLAMVDPIAIIESAFEEFSHYAQLASSKDPSVPHDGSARDPAVALYQLLTSTTPSNVNTAMKKLQQYVLGTQGVNVGVLGYLPRLVQDQWSKCAMSANNQTDVSEYLHDNFGPFYDSVGHIVRDCIKPTFTLEGDGSATGASVHAIASQILATQLKGVAFLTAAWGHDPLNQFHLDTYIMPNVKRIGENLAALWPALANPTEIDGVALDLLKQHGQTLSLTRANQYWYQVEDNDVCADCDWYFQGVANSGSGIDMNMFATVCTVQYANCLPGFPCEWERSFSYPCLVSPPASLASGYDSATSRAVAISFNKSSGKGLQYQWNHAQASFNIAAPHTFLPAMPSFLAEITKQYPVMKPVSDAPSLL